MFLISWNVAGWSSTAQAIRDSYGSIEAFFELTGADVICLQECKGSWAKLEADPIAMGAKDPLVAKCKAVPPVVVDNKVASPVDISKKSAPSSSGGINGWESFWCFSDKQHRGFNGVVTFAREGLVFRCNARPFPEEEFNDEGRVVVTELSAFVLVNVYVPNARNGARSHFKDRFLRSLRRLLQKLRQDSGRPVVLAGDLNLTYRTEDVCWNLRRIDVLKLVALRDRSLRMEDEEWSRLMPGVGKTAVQRVANLVANTLCMRVMECGIEPASSSTTSDQALTCNDELNMGALGEEKERRAAVVSSVDDPSAVNANTVTKGQIRLLNDVLRSLVVPSEQLRYSVASPPIQLSQLLEAGLDNLLVDDLTRSYPPSHNEELYSVVRFCGRPPHGEESAHFMQCLLTGEEFGETQAASSPRMYDTFLLPNAKSGDSASWNTSYCPCPYTCWDQSRNRRLINEGTRLDYILVDADLASMVVPRSDTENNTGFAKVPSAADGGCPVVAASSLSQPQRAMDELSEYNGKMRDDGIRRAMAGGAYPSAPFDGTGLPPLHDAARGHVFRGLPSTGLFVTPPQFSDHCGVCVQFREGADGGFSLQSRCAKVVVEPTKCRYRPPANLFSFFMKPNCTSVGSSAPLSTSSVSRHDSRSPLCNLPTSQPTVVGTHGGSLKRGRDVLADSTAEGVIDVDEM